jgi:CubicO group peptidase (beta-lactamase class C family)
LRFECGGGGLASTTFDYLRFAQMLLGGGILGDTRILGRKTVEAMRTNRMTPDIENRIAELDPNSAGYGFGLTVAVRERASTLMGSRGEFYWNGAYGTLSWADPVEDLAGHCHVNFVWAARSGGSPAAPIMLRVGCMSPGARF